MNNDLISRSALLENAYETEMWNRETQKFDLKVVDVDDVITAPTVDAEPVRHGRWVGTSCSNCLSDLSSWADAAYGVIENGDLMWCPHCGAKMDAEVEG